MVVELNDTSKMKDLIIMGTVVSNRPLFPSAIILQFYRLWGGPYNVKAKYL